MCHHASTQQQLRLKVALFFATEQKMAAVVWTVMVTLTLDRLKPAAPVQLALLWFSKHFKVRKGTPDNKKQHTDHRRR